LTSPAKIGVAFSFVCLRLDLVWYKKS